MPVLALLITACGTVSATPSHSQVRLVVTRHPHKELTLAQASHFVSFQPQIPNWLPTGFTLTQVQVEPPPYQTPAAKKVTMLTLKFTSPQGTMFLLTETALRVQVGGAHRVSTVDGHAIWLQTEVRNGLTIVSGTVRVHGVSYTLTAPGTLSASAATRLLASLAS
jgi:hypothetical protein